MTTRSCAGHTPDTEGVELLVDTGAGQADRRYEEPGNSEFAQWVGTYPSTYPATGLTTGGMELLSYTVDADGAYFLSHQHHPAGETDRE